MNDSISTAVKARPATEDPVANRIRTRRLALGWSLKRLSEATGGLAPSFLFNIENSRKVPSEEVAARIAHAIDDTAHEATYRAWARAKSRGRTGRIDHDAMLSAWELLRNPFGEPAAPGVAPAAPVGESRDAGRLRVPVLATASDPGDGVRPIPEQVINTLSLDPLAYGHDAELARERYSRLRRPFAFPLDEEQAKRAGLMGATLAVVTRDEAISPDPNAAYVVRVEGRLEVVRGSAYAGGEVPGSLRNAGLDRTEDLRAATVGRIDHLLPDVRL
ncbi:MAG: helix-turn-helix transcriptional regulator [Candidatus Eisenbacteria bacterium]|uniref:Helix-turn-helix transcriptional regulator n=1 Tax=Eiseniibacteriota bacterium TaxID=2212470 RepID=A0A933W2P7_UNCEI|nr:helix-turn-helix transcriptional regulator [Candidatus Eisenbacteria bacterium]